ncbi:hypothetical protein [Microcoleus sp. B13-B4]
MVSGFAAWLHWHFLKLVLISVDRSESCDRRSPVPPFFGELFSWPYLYLLRDLLRQRE